MAREVFFDDERPGRRLGGLALGVIALGLFALAAFFMIYSQFRIDVPEGHIAILISKTGKDLPNGAEVAPTAEHKGVQREVLSEGRYFKNPFFWDWEVVEQLQVPEGNLAVLISRTGDDLGYGQFLAKVDKDGTPTTKGIVPEALRPGRYPVNPYLFDWELHKPVVIPAGYKGVVTNLAGPFPKEINQLLSEKGERGVQKETLDAGTYYVNPYVTRVNLVDCRSQRFNLAENDDMGFPSKDGFWVSLDGAIEFRIQPERAAEVFVLYNETGTASDVMAEEIIRKVILPNARSFCRLEGSNSLGREFIGTRRGFQEKFQEAMRNACQPVGIEIIQALITRIKPPEQIAKPVRDREIAKQQEQQFVQQIEQQKSEQKLAIQKELVNQGQALVQAQQAVVRVTTEAEREQEVAVTKAEEQQAVAELQLEAAKAKAEAILARGKAEADVVEFQNQAEAAGWKRAVEAFGGDGNQYARFVLFQKMASAYRDIMVNTADSPIMKIFESFTAPAPGGSPPAPETKAASDTNTAAVQAD